MITPYKIYRIDKSEFNSQHKLCFPKKIQFFLNYQNELCPMSILSHTSGVDLALSFFFCFFNTIEIDSTKVKFYKSFTLPTQSKEIGTLEGPSGLEGRTKRSSSHTGSRLGKSKNFSQSIFVFFFCFSMVTPTLFSCYPTPAPQKLSNFSFSTAYPNFMMPQKGFQWIF